MSNHVTIVIEVHDEASDPDDATGLTEEAYNQLVVDLPGDIVSIERSES